MWTYEHHVFLRAKCDRVWSGVVGVFSCGSWLRFNRRPAIDLRRLAARARVARSESWAWSGEEAAWEQVLMCACAIATCRSLVERLRRPRASQVAHRPSSIGDLVRPARPRRGHWASIVSSGRGSDGLTDVIRRAMHARPFSLDAREFQGGVLAEGELDRYTDKTELMR
jgi:hypothetical protein